MTLRYTAETDKYEYADKPPQEGEALLAWLFVFTARFLVFAIPLAIIFLTKPILAIFGFDTHHFSIPQTLFATAISLAVWYVSDKVIYLFTSNVKYIIFRRMKSESEHPVIGSSARAKAYYKRRFGDVLSWFTTRASWPVSFAAFFFLARFGFGAAFMFNVWFFLGSTLIIGCLLTAILSVIAFSK